MTEYQPDELFCFIILGNSGAGKDTFAECLDNAVNGYVAVTKFSRYYKAIVENDYELPNGALDYDYYKKRLVPGYEDTTFLDLLVNKFHDQSQSFTNEKIAHTIDTARYHIENGNHIAFTDVRMTKELISVLLFCAEYKLLVHAFVVQRDSEVALTTDHALQDSIKLLNDSAIPVDFIDNNGSLERLQMQANGAAEMFK